MNKSLDLPEINTAVLEEMFGLRKNSITEIRTSCDEDGSFIIKMKLKPVRELNEKK